MELLKLMENLTMIAKKEKITFVSGAGKHKPQLQKLYEELKSCGERLLHYKEYFEIMGKDRTDYHTLIPVVEKHKRMFGIYPKEDTVIQRGHRKVFPYEICNV